MSTSRGRLLAAAAALFATIVYLTGLDGQHIPKNGDENPYVNITRLTAASGHWLPLQTDIEGMRNTKPPLLFWQGIVTTDHGRQWSLWNLRLPSVVYTLLTALLVGAVAWKAGAGPAAGIIGALSFLAFFSTYRYGRPFLTNAPETFWLFLPYAILIWRGELALQSGWLALPLGLCIGIGLLYKSFALLLPAGLALAWWQLHQRDYALGRFVRADAWKLAVVAALALGVFLLWPALDPAPRAIWEDFVVRENAGKFSPSGATYLRQLLWGGSSVWTMILGIPANAALLGLPVAALMGAALRAPRQLNATEKALWIWVLALVIAFTLPSQRSSRYLLAAMPAIAALCGAGWHRLHRGWFIATLGLCGFGIGFLGYESWRLEQALGDGTLFAWGYWLVMGLGVAFCAVAMVRPDWSRAGTPVAGLWMLLAIGLFLTPIDGARGRFNASAESAVAGRDVWVPVDFAAGEEGYRFLLPAARLHAYVEVHDEDSARLAARYPLFTVRLPLDGAACAGCQVLGQRLDLRGRLSPADTQALLHGQVFATIMMKELLVAAPAP